MRDLCRFRWLPVALLVAGLLVTPVVADTRKGGGDVGWDIGTTRLDDDIAEANAWRMDLRAGYMLTNMFQIEGQIGWTDRHDITLYTGFANAVFNFRTSQRTMPYLLVGIGAGWMDLSIDDDTGGGLQAATGVKAFGEKGRMGLRLELGAMALDTFDEQTVNWNFTVGFVFDLGKHHGHKRNKPRPGTRASYYY